MMPAERGQNDDESEKEWYGALAAIDCSKDPDPARQEFKDEADVNYLLQRFGVGALTDKKPVYTETDFNTDLQQAMDSIHQAQDAWTRLPKHLQEKYPSWQSFLNGMARGDEMPLEEPREPEDPKPGKEGGVT